MCPIKTIIIKYNIFEVDLVLLSMLLLKFYFPFFGANLRNNVPAKI